MATTSFKKTDPSATQNDTPQQPTTESAVAVRQEQPLARPIKVDDFGGAWDQSDVKLPRINLVHKTSKEESITKFGIGAFVLNQEVKLSNGKSPLDVTVLFSDKDLIQKKPFGDPEPPVVCKTVQEVLDKGGTLNFRDSDGTNLFIPRAHITLLVPAPEGATEADLALFPYEFDGKSYAVAIYTVSSSAYTSVGKDLATFRTQNKVMRKGTIFGRLTLTSEDRKDAKNSWKVPVIKFTGENTPEFVDFIKSLSPA